LLVAHRLLLELASVSNLFCSLCSSISVNCPCNLNISQSFAPLYNFHIIAFRFVQVHISGMNPKKPKKMMVLIRKSQRHSGTSNRLHRSLHKQAIFRGLTGSVKNGSIRLSYAEDQSVLLQHGWGKYLAKSAWGK
jgi:hypothetical protein